VITWEGKRVTFDWTIPVHRNGDDTVWRFNVGTKVWILSYQSKKGLYLYGSTPDKMRNDKLVTLRSKVVKTLLSAVNKSKWKDKVVEAALSTNDPIALHLMGQWYGSKPLRSKRARRKGDIS